MPWRGTRGSSRSRDKRKTKTQKVEFDALAPDTAEEIFQALALLELWTGKAELRRRSPSASADDELLRVAGRGLLAGSEEATADLEILGERMENSGRKVVLVKVHKAYRAYRDMLHYYAVKNLLDHLQADPRATLATMLERLGGERQREWVNLGGQLVPAPDATRLQDDIKSGALNSWHAIHARYGELWDRYPEQKQRHALATLRSLLEIERLEPEHWLGALNKAVRIQEYVRDQVYRTRKKDYDEPFRRITYRNADEQRAVLGSPETNSFVRQVARETEVFKEAVEAARQRG